MKDLLLKLYRSQFLRAVFSAAILALAIATIYIWSERHDNPEATYLELSDNITLEGNPVSVKIGCTCPKFLIENDVRDLPFDLTLTLPQNSFPAIVFASKRPPAISVSIDAENSRVIPTGLLVTDNGYTILKNQGLVKASTTLRIEPRDASLSQITFDFKSYYGDGSLPSSLGSVVWPIESDKPALSILWPYGLVFVVFCGAAGLFYWVDKRLQAAREKREEHLKDARSQAEKNPKEARFAWDLARVKLEAYFDRNLIQVNLVFWVAVFVMAVGFGFVLAGVVLAYSQPKPDQWSYLGASTPTPSQPQSQSSQSQTPHNEPAQFSQSSRTASEQSSGATVTPSLVAAVSGIITQFIGATFMVIYRSTMAQANDFMTVLERINTVGMAVQVLDSLPEGTDLKNETRSQMVLLLLNNGNNPKGGKAAATKSADGGPTDNSESPDSKKPSA